MKVFVVLDIGCNWVNKPNIKEMIAEASTTGADAVKFQYYSTDEIRAYEVQHPPSKYTQAIYNEIRKKELTIDDFKGIADTCRAWGLEFMCTPFVNPEKVWELDPLVNRHKVRQRDSRNRELVAAALRTEKPVYVSITAFRYDSFVELPENYLQVYCIPDYPARWEQLMEMGSSLEAAACYKGYSNHIPDIAAPLAMVLGAWLGGYTGEFYLEVHYKSAGTFPVDDAVSFDAGQVKKMVEVIRSWERELFPLRDLIPT